MSVRAIAWAFDQELPTTLKFVLVALADNANDEGLCWPGQKHVAEKTGLKRPTVNKAIASLAELGKLETIRRFDDLGRPRSNQYRLALGGNVIVADVDGDAQSQGIVSDADTEPSLRTIKEPKTDHRNDLPPNHADVDSTVWADAPWLLKFLKEQHTFNGNKLPKLLDYGWWSDLSEAVNGVDLPFVTAEFGKMGVWLRDNAARAPTEKGVRRFVATWLQRAAEQRRRQSGNQNQTRR